MTPAEVLRKANTGGRAWNALETGDPIAVIVAGLQSMHGLRTTECEACKKPMLLHEEIAGCIVYCDDCPFPPEDCESCGLKDPPQGHDCCQCEYCIERRAIALAEGGKR